MHLCCTESEYRRVASSPRDRVVSLLEWYQLSAGGQGQGVFESENPGRSRSSSIELIGNHVNLDR
jgi:hypothetical protein